jgi:CBS domain-containing protein
MMVNEIMSSDIQVIDVDAPIQQAAEMMDKLDVGFLPVALGNKLAGAVTDRDIVVRGVAAGLDLHVTPVQKIMTLEPASISEYATVEQASDLMKQKQIRRLLVLNVEGNVVGVVSLGDLATEVENDQLAGETLEKVPEDAT